MLIDRYGREISVMNGEIEDVYVINGAIVKFPAGTPEEKVIDTFDAMAPIDWVEPPTISDINKECQRRIFAVASENTQKNLLTNSTTNLLSEEEQQSYRDGLVWINATRAAANTLKQTLDPTYKDNTHWPSAPANFVLLCKNY